jgi:putative glycosyltransferase (TIGR04348 family)
MRIAIVTPAAASTRTGNRHTAQRYAAFLRAAGHRVQVASAWDGGGCDLMIALHARQSYESIARLHTCHPGRPLVVVLTGTDVYRDIQNDPAARRSLELATLLITLQDQAGGELQRCLRGKVRVVYQSANVARVAAPPQRRFRVCVVGHLREEKDPFRAALALAHLPAERPIEIVQVGDALSPEMASEARRLMRVDARYRWVGGVPHSGALAWLAHSHLLVVSSRMEGGANVICEAARAGVPVVASRVPGNVGMLGRGYRGYFPAGDAARLAQLIQRFRDDAPFRRALIQDCRARRALFAPARERAALLKLMQELWRGAKPGYFTTSKAR